MGFSIRPVREEDAASIIEVLNPIIQAGDYTIMDGPVSVEDQTGFIRGLPEMGIFNVAVCDDSRKVIGLQDVAPRPGRSRAFSHIGEISTFVSLGSHRNGIGRSLSKATFREAQERGFRKLCATIRADNPQAVSFYLSQGFRIVGTARKHALVRGDYIDEVLAEMLIDGD